VAFEQRRLRVDWVTPEREVGVLTFAWLCVARRWHGRAVLEWHPADGPPRVLPGIVDPPVRRPDEPVDEVSVVLEGGEVLEVVLDARWPSWEPEEPCPIPEVGWRVAVPRAAVRATWSDGRISEGEGYADWTWATWPLRRLGLQTWRWGRAHLDDRTVVFLDVRLAGHEWRVGADWIGGPTNLEAMRLGFDADGGGAVGLGGRGPRDCELWLDPGRVLRDAPVVDAGRWPRWVERMVAEGLDGPAHETRWLSDASLRGPGVDRKVRGVALHELVSFGTRTG